MQNPENYFTEKAFSLPDRDADEVSPAERAFLEKYMGMGAANIATLPAAELSREKEEKRPLENAANVEQKKDTKVFLDSTEVSKEAESLQTKKSKGVEKNTAGAAQKQNAKILSAKAEEKEIGKTPDKDLSRQPYVQLVEFTVNSKSYSIPIILVQEVIRYTPPTRLPVSPYFMTGIINLRGKVTPVIDLGSLLCGDCSEAPKKAIMICQYEGLQLGLLIDQVNTMYTVDQSKLEWGVDQYLSGSTDLIEGLIKADGGELVGIISISKVVSILLKK